MTTASEGQRQCCPHCGCGYFVRGDSPDEGICHDCGRRFELEPYDAVPDLVALFKDLDPEQRARFLKQVLD